MTNFISRIFGQRDERNIVLVFVDAENSTVSPALILKTVETEFGSDIANATPASPVVITPDVAKGIQWTGALIYVNDLEGKITKINLTNQSDVELYAQTTLFNLRANKANGRYNYHSMDAAIGKDTNNFWLFGGTGNYERIGQARPWMDNILYGVKDPNYPKFKHLYDLEIPEEASNQFVTKAHEVAEAANHVNDPAICVNTTTDRDGTLCPTNKNQAWVIHLDKRDGKAAGESINRYRKVSATPTVYKGNVYFPIYLVCQLTRLLIENFSVAQVNQTVTVGRGTVRGLHYQTPPFADTKVVTCLRGRVFDVAVDVRPGDRHADGLLDSRHLGPQELEQHPLPGPVRLPLRASARVG